MKYFTTLLLLLLASSGYAQEVKLLDNDELEIKVNKEGKASLASSYGAEDELDISALTQRVDEITDTVNEHTDQIVELDKRIKDLEEKPNVAVSSAPSLSVPSLSTTLDPVGTVQSHTPQVTVQSSAKSALAASIQASLESAPIPILQTPVATASAWKPVAGSSRVVSVGKPVVTSVGEPVTTSVSYGKPTVTSVSYGPATTTSVQTSTPQVSWSAPVASPVVVAAPVAAPIRYVSAPTPVAAPVRTVYLQSSQPVCNGGRCPAPASSSRVSSRVSSSSGSNLGGLFGTGILSGNFLRRSGW